MKKLVAFIALALALSARPAGATTIDFESVSVGTYSSLTFGPVTVGFVDGNGNFDVQDQSPGAPLSGHMLISYFRNPGSGSFEATFAGGASSVSLNFGDYSPSDDDEGHLRAYDALNNLLASDFFLVPTSGPGGTLTVSNITPIARVEWNETGSFAGAVYWDNLTYEAASQPDQPVPEPASLTLLGLGLAGMGTRRWRQRKAS